MIRYVAALAALVITGLVVTAALAFVGWFMHSPAVWAIARMPWFTPTVIALNSLWLTIWLPLYVSRANKKKAAEEKPFRLR